MDWPDDILPARAAALFESGRRVCHVSPGHALVLFRAAASALAGAWLETTDEREHGTLHGRLGAVVERVPSAVGAVDALHIVRRLGNLGAHPEQRSEPLGLADVERAHQAFHAALCAWAVDAGELAAEQLPALVPLPETDWSTVCREALFERDEDALLVVAARMADEAREQRDRLHRQSNEALVDVSSTFPHLEDAVALYRVAWRHHRSAPAAREAAVLLLDDLKRSFEEARGLLVPAAVDGDAGAQWRLAMLHLDGDARLGGEHNLDEGLALLEAAAGGEHPVALHELARRTLRGEAGERRSERALALLRRSADAGFPQGRVEFVESLLRGHTHTEVEEEVSRHRVALESDAPDLARWVDFVVARAEGGPCSEAEFSSLEALLFRQYPPARLARARWRLSQAPTVERLTSAGNDAATALRHGDAPATWCAARQVLYRVMKGLAALELRTPQREDALLSLGPWLALEDKELPNRSFLPATLHPITACLSRLGVDADRPLSPPERRLLRRAFPDRGSVPQLSQRIRGRRRGTYGARSKNMRCICGSGRPFKACCRDQSPLPVWPGPETSGG